MFYSVNSPSNSKRDADGPLQRPSELDVPFIVEDKDKVSVTRAQRAADLEEEAERYSVL